MQELSTVVILTALRVEYNAVRNLLESISEINEDDTIYEEGTFTMDGSDIARVIIRQCGQRNEIAALETQRAISLFSPDMMFFVGIAGSRKPSDFKVGDVIVAEKIYSYEGGKALGEDFLARPDSLSPPHPIIESAKFISKDNTWKGLIKGVSGVDHIKGDVGIIASGDKLIESSHSQIGDVLTKHYNDTHAVEMEGFGFAKAASKQGRSLGLLLYGVVRGISDILENENMEGAKRQEERNKSLLMEKRTEGVKELASSTAAAFTYYLIFKLVTSSKKKRMSVQAINF